MALKWRDEHKNRCLPILTWVDIHGPLLLLSRPRYLHVWSNRGPTWGLAVQQYHPEEELVLRSAGSWLKSPGTTEEEDEVAHSELSQRTAPPQLLSHGVLLLYFLVHIFKSALFLMPAANRVLLCTLLKPSVGCTALMSQDEECSHAFPTPSTEQVSSTQNP